MHSDSRTFCLPTFALEVPLVPLLAVLRSQLVPASDETVGIPLRELASFAMCMPHTHTPILSIPAAGLPHARPMNQAPPQVGFFIGMLG